MLFLEDIKIELKCQGYEAKHLTFSPDGDSSIVYLESIKKTKDVVCPACSGQVHIYDSFDTTLKDMPIYPDVPLSLFCIGHRYRCLKCKNSFTEDIPFAYPGTRITKRAALWIKGFLKNKLSIRAIQNLTGIHWDTIRKVQQEIIDEELDERVNELVAKDYKPRYLAVDELPCCLALLNLYIILRYKLFFVVLAERQHQQVSHIIPRYSWMSSFGLMNQNQDVHFCEASIHHFPI